MNFLTIPWVRTGGAVLIVLFVLFAALKITDYANRAERAEDRAEQAEKDEAVALAEKAVLTQTVRTQNENIRKMTMAYENLGTRITEVRVSNEQRWKQTDRVMASFNQTATTLINAPAAPQHMQCEVARAKLKDVEGIRFAPAN